MTRAMTSELPSPSWKTPILRPWRPKSSKALKYRVGKDATVATPHDWLTASIQVVRDRIIDHWIEVDQGSLRTQEKRVYYLSLEFLIGRLMRDAFSNLGLLD